MGTIAPRVLVIVGLAAALAGCERAMHDMYDQRRYKPLSPTTLFPDGQIARPLPADTVPMASGALAGTSSGRAGGEPVRREPTTVYPVDEQGQRHVNPTSTLAPPELPPSRIPEPITAQLLMRGQERFNIYCLPCHSAVGDGDGLIVRRGFPSPPSYHTERLRRAPDSHFYNVITNGYGAMFPYADRVNPADRWAIVAYIRALQLSQHATLADVPAAARAELNNSRAQPDAAPVRPGNSPTQPNNAPAQPERALPQKESGSK